MNICVFVGNLHFKQRYSWCPGPRDSRKFSDRSNSSDFAIRVSNFLSVFNLQPHSRTRQQVPSARAIRIAPAIADTTDAHGPGREPSVPELPRSSPAPKSSTSTIPDSHPLPLSAPNPPLAPAAPPLSLARLSSGVKEHPLLFRVHHAHLIRSSAVMHGCSNLLQFVQPKPTILGFRDGKSHILRAVTVCRELPLRYHGNVSWVGAFAGGAELGAVWANGGGDEYCVED